jgi:ABC-2 type transport system ATP-binding protein
MTMIEVNGLTKRYGKTLAVDRLSFRVEPGVVTGFVGPNGAGKSTTMRMVLGLDRPTAGTATVAGRPYHQLVRPLRQVGAMLDATAVHPRRSAYDHLLALARSNGIARARVGEVLERVGLTGVARRRVRAFSLGMRQRLGIAAALLGDPPILLFDEPINGLDPEGIAWIRSLMQGLAAEGRTVFLSSHLMSEMEDTAERLVVIGRGRLVAETSVAEFVASGTRAEVRVVAPHADALADALTRSGADVVRQGTEVLVVSGMPAARIGDLAAEHGLALHELTPQRARLEAAFMQLTQDSVEYAAEAVRS